MNNGILSKEDILCMQYSGMKSSQIMNPNLAPEEYAEAFETYIDKVESVMSMQEEHGITTLTFHDELFPYSLRKIGHDCPPIIHCLGDMSLLATEANRIAIIGARAADKDGLDMAYGLAKQMGEQGHIVISGLALGCDTAAHQGCLDADGQTIALVASGLDITHPRVNKSLQDEIIAKGGAILSEYPFGVKANPTKLVARCRMQVVLTQSVIVAQCPIISGTMYAVRFAQEYNGVPFGWENKVYSVRYDTQNELNSGNKFLLDYNLALPIRPGQEVTLDNDNRLVIYPYY